ncbi:OmpH family outer membrane protein [Opacimonas viscosa]|uniref:OmpH family outer membrane protein n=1 Tax=Opacimonas viscosa TaxID=2961944 RepID=A0AA42BKH2_9ALTE|nr:OmpH family outer membrane protein [Opacimonas viscosa]MCP3427778.1 OmpH family outer membrane protein [Opacimonas viscosa]
MKTFTQTLIKTLLLATIAVSASASAMQKIAVVDVQAVLQSLPQTQAIVASINNEFKAQFEEVQNLQKDGEFNVEKLRRDGATMSEAQKKELETKIMDIRAQLQQKATPLQQEVQRRQNEEQTKLLGLVKQAIDAISAAEDYDLVLNAGAATFVKPEFNISQKVIDRVSQAN